MMRGKALESALVRAQLAGDARRLHMFAEELEAPMLSGPTAMLVCILISRLNREADFVAIHSGRFDE